MKSYRVKRDSEDEHGADYRFQQGGTAGAMAFSVWSEDLVASTPADAPGPHLAAVLLYLAQLEKWPETDSEIIAEKLTTYPKVKVAFEFQEYARDIINGRR